MIWRNDLEDGLEDILEAWTDGKISGIGHLNSIMRILYLCTRSILSRSQPYLDITNSAKIIRARISSTSISNGSISGRSISTASKA